MNWNLFLLMFYGKVFIIYAFVGYLLVRYMVLCQDLVQVKMRFSSS